MKDIDAKTIDELERIVEDVRHPRMKGGGFDLVRLPTSLPPMRLMVMHGFATVMSLKVEFRTDAVRWNIESTLPGLLARIPSYELPKYVPRSGMNTAVLTVAYDSPEGWATVWGLIRHELETYECEVIEEAAEAERRLETNA